jgi:hypothetical protein
MSLATGFHGAKGFLSLGRILLCCSARVARRAAGRRRNQGSREYHGDRVSQQPGEYQAV